MRVTSRSTLLTLGFLIAATVSVVPGAGAAAGDPGGDPLVGEQWGLEQVRAPGAWATTTGDGATIAVVDTGVDLDHEDLAANVVPGNTFIDCGDDGCGDGDWESAEGEGHPHGTHVAGIAAAVGGNGIGISGVAPDASILPIKAMDASGSGSFEDIARGIRWAVDRGADVVNLSLGALPGVQALEVTGLVTDLTDAVAHANASGVVVVAAAGNEAVPLCDSPGFHDGVLCVGATDVNGAKAWYSNNPVKPDTLTVAAPGGTGAVIACGVEILSTVPMGTSFEACGHGPDYEEALWFGTSMAAPHVAGLAGLLAAEGCTRDVILDAITTTARVPHAEERGAWNPIWGYGLVDAEAAVAAAACSAGEAVEQEPGADEGPDEPVPPEDPGPPGEDPGNGPPEERGPSDEPGRPDEPAGTDEPGRPDARGPDGATLVPWGRVR